MARIKTFHFEADGNAYNLNLGWVPDYVKIMCANAATGEVVETEWFKDMDDDAGFITTVIADNGVTSDKNKVYAGSGAGISEYDSTSVQTTNPVMITGGKGVTIAAALMDNSDEVWGIAIQSDEDKDIGDVA
jgi:hypothetical protein